ncbi:unnamed protein product [Chrysodeixis includens]|uniref:Ketosynthase family 3 (KS3) domain-containing protein n=1 Tax=Chrysodeixis includens TaxID=689277 RepID=A0A9P0G0U0_CHRIL|nr:unnamed protein product [Chrysodeixis includens]
MASCEKFREFNLQNGTESLTGEEVVISGISGTFPNSENVIDFMNNLYDKVDMVTSADPKWKFNDPDLPKHVGQIYNMNKFDAQFFGVSFQLSCVLEPMGRKLLEHTYGAFIDAGINPQDIRGKRVGVFIGSTIPDQGTNTLFDVNCAGGSDAVINGGSKAMFANRISYWMDAKGPSFTVDYDNAGSTACLQMAYSSIKSGQCEAAIVGGCSYITHPCATLNMRKLGMLCLDGKTKSFDKNADGYVRADAINVLFLQKAKNAHRIYAQVYHAKGNYHLRPDAGFLYNRESEDLEKFYKEFYSETDVDPKNIEYIEANGVGLPLADATELTVIGNIFAKDNTVKIGSVKSNMGHSEAASGVVGVTKLCLAYHKGKLPANLHYNEPQDQIPAIRDGRIKVLDDHADFDRGFTAMNNFSFGGGNYHVVLKGIHKEKNLDKYKSQIPHLVLASGRQEPSVQKVIDIMKSHPIDPEEIGLLHKVYEHDVSGHTGRGYAILGQNENKETISLGESVDYYPGVKRPLWFVYSGMGSQWAGMGADLMKIPVFAAAIHKCHKVLEPKGVDVIRIVTERDESIFDNILNAFVGIGAIQIGLTDVIKALGVVPDYIIGHSLGEMACAYHDDTFTAEELILATYSRGKVCLETELIKGSMAAVGIGYNTIVHQCPPEIDIACHNSSESTTISGPADKMKEFVGELTKQGIFAKEVPCANIAYHSRYIAHCGPGLLKHLRDILKNPKKRSSKWISTSVPQSQWGEPNAMYSSAEYHTNNLLKPVLFEEAGSLIPDNAVVIEIAPHGLLQAILKRSHSKCTLIPLTRRGSNDSVKFLLDAIGKMYQAGINPKVDALYPKIEFPVSTTTPLLSHLVEWEHSENWPQYDFSKTDNRISTSRGFPLSLHDDDYKFLEGCVRDDLTVLPESALLVLVWETLAMSLGRNYREQSVIFRNITFFCEAIINPDVSLNLTIAINRGSETFEISQNDKPIVAGEVNLVKVLHYIREKESPKDTEKIVLTKDDIYKILKSKGYSYKDKFQSIQSSNIDRTDALVQWDKNWITFLDSLIQLKVLARKHDGISTPKFIRQLRISMGEHEVATIEELNGVSCYTAKYNELLKVVRCAGVELVDVTFVDRPIIEQQPEVLVSQEFYPHYATNNVDLKTALLVNLQVVAENTTKKSIQVTQFVTSNKNINCLIAEIADNVPNVQIEVASVLEVANLEAAVVENTDPEKANVFVIEDLLIDEKKLESLRNLSKDSFVLALENEVPKLQGVIKEHFSVVTSMSDGKQILILLKRQNPKDVTYISVNCDNKLDWVSRVYDELNKTKRVVLVSERQPYCGALGLVQKLRSDGVENIGLVAIDDFHAPDFSAKHVVYKSQLEKNLTINIFKKGEWGGLYYSPVSTSAKLKNVTLTSQTGDLDDLTWVEAPTPVASKNRIQVSYAGISLKDSEIAISSTKRQEKLGMDYSGINADGDRVMGLVSGGALGGTVEADPDLLWPVPEHWSLQDAATVPLPYAIAYYCLTLRNQLFRNQRVYVSGGAGALGQAVIAVCLSLDCTVYTSVSTMSKKKMLLRLFPKLHEKNVCHIRNAIFMDVIKNGMKIDCDFVINCANGDLRELAMSCVTTFGVFVDLSSYDCYVNKGFGMSYLEEDRAYTYISFSNIFRPEFASDKKSLQRTIAEGIAKGTVRPISRVEYSPIDITKAFRLLSSSKHVGKVLIKMRSPEILAQGFNVIPRINYDSKGVYIVICDETGLGIELADRLVKKGARNIVLHSKSTVSGYWQSKFVSWKENNVEIKISTDNLQTQQGCTKMLMDAAKLGPVKGIFVVPEIDTKTNDKPEDFVIKFNKTVNAVININMTSKTYCNDLSHFVVIASPTNNASSEFVYSVLEKILKGRTETGFPALFLRSALQKPNTDEILRSNALSVLFNAMETSLKLKYKNVLFYNLKKDNKENYLKKLVAILVNWIAGVPSVDKYLDHTVGRLLYEVNLEEIQTLIRNSYEIDYPTEKIQRMTVESLINVGENKTQKPKAVSGLATFYPTVDDEKYIIGTHPIMPMKTLVNPGCETDLDPNETYVTLIPGFQGRYQIFDNLAEGLKIQAVAAQIPADFEGNTIPEMAAEIRKFMKTKFETKSKFYLLGYSFGVNLALEIAALLEKEGHIGVVYCLDSSPDALKIQLKSHLGDLTKPELENVVLNHLYETMSGQKSEELQKYLSQENDWLSKVNACMFKLKGLAANSHQYNLSILTSALNRILLAKNYQPEFKLESEIVLIKGVPHPTSEDLGEDYSLSKYSKQPVKVFNITSDHVSAPYDTRISNIVNKLLDPSLIEEFRKKNLCNTYALV